MELQAACMIIFNILTQQKFSMQEHQQIQAAFIEIAPKCEDALKKAQEEAAKKAKK